MRHYIIAISLFSTSACTMSNLDPDVEVDLHGSAQYDTGQALVDQKIALVKHADLGEVLAGIILGPATIIACLSDSPPPICADASIEQSDASGRFHFSMYGQDTQGSLGFASNFTASTGLPAIGEQLAGPSTYHRFQIQDEFMQLPPMVLWKTELSFENNAQSMNVTLPDDTPFIDLHFETESLRNTPIWAVSEYKGELLDSRIFEDAQLTLAAIVNDVTRVAGVNVETTIRSATYSIVGQAGAPPSRGARCFVSTEDGSLEEHIPCQLSDGDLASGFPPIPQPECEEESCDESQANQLAVVDLGELMSARLLVLRLGLYDSKIEISEDGENWQTLTTSGNGSTQINLPPSTTLRYLRVSALGIQQSLLGLSEISVW